MITIDDLVKVHQPDVAIVATPEPANTPVIEITEFRGTTRFLSNFYRVPHGLRIADHTVPTVEHGYHMCKTMRSEWPRILAYSARQCGDLKRAAKGMKLNPKATTPERLRMMKGLLKQKFREGSDLAHQLLATKDALIVEGNYWHDNFWGDCTCQKCAKRKGENHMGRLLMQVRADLRGDNIKPIAPIPLEQWSMKELRAKAKELGITPLPRKKVEMVRQICINSSKVDFRVEDTRPLWWRKHLEIDRERIRNGENWRQDYPKLAHHMGEHAIPKGAQLRFQMFEEVCALLDKEDAHWREHHLKQLGEMDPAIEERVRETLAELRNEALDGVLGFTEDQKMDLSELHIYTASTKDDATSIARKAFDQGQATVAHICYSGTRGFIVAIDQPPPYQIRHHAAKFDVHCTMRKSKFAPGYYTDLSMQTPGYIKAYSCVFNDRMNNKEIDIRVWADDSNGDGMGNALNKCVSQFPGINPNEVEVTEIDREYAEAKVYDTQAEAEIIMAENDGYDTDTAKYRDGYLTEAGYSHLY